MSIRPKNKKRSFDPLPDLTRRREAIEDVLRTQKVDFDPTHDIDEVHKKDDLLPTLEDLDMFCGRMEKREKIPLSASVNQDMDFDPIRDVETVGKNSLWFSPEKVSTLPSYSATYTATENLPADVAFAEAEQTLQDLYKRYPETKPDKEVIDMNPLYHYTGQDFKDMFHPEQAWIQTYSGRRFNPMAPIPESIVIQDIAHALANQCRFSGHVKNFYSVAQHCVLVSYICDSQDALWGLLHDATEAYLVDVPRPIKRSGKLEGYIQCEAVMQKAICLRFGLPSKEPSSVHMADTKLLATEARDLLINLRSDWTQPLEPLPFKIVALPPEEAKHLYLARFFELINAHPKNYAQYLEWEAKDKI